MAVRAAGAGAATETPVRIRLETLGDIGSSDSVIQFSDLEPDKVLLFPTGLERYSLEEDERDLEALRLHL